MAIILVFVWLSQRVYYCMPKVSEGQTQINFLKVCLLSYTDYILSQAMVE